MAFLWPLITAERLFMSFLDNLTMGSAKYLALPWPSGAGPPHWEPQRHRHPEFTRQVRPSICDGVSHALVSEPGKNRVWGLMGVCGSNLKDNLLSHSFQHLRIYSLIDIPTTKKFDKHANKHANKLSNN